MRLNNRLRTIAVLLTAAAAVAGCSDDSDENADISAAEANAALCAERAEFEQVVSGAPSSDPASTTVGDVKAARDEVGEAVDGVSEATAAAMEAEGEAVEQALEELADSLSGLDDDALVQDVAADAAAARDEVATATDELFSAADCP